MFWNISNVLDASKTVFPNIANFWMFWNVLWNALFRRAPGARCGLCVLQQFAARQPGLSQLKRSSCSRSSGLSIRLDSVPACHSLVLNGVPSSAPAPSQFDTARISGSGTG